MPKRAVKLIKNNRVTPKRRLIAMRQEIKRQTEPVIKQGVDLHKLTTEGWSSENRGKFTYKIENVNNTTGNMRWTIKHEAQTADGSDKTVRQLLSEGTSSRHAVMKFPYDRKTRPNRIGNFGDGGDVAFISRNVNMRSPDTGEFGITARNFEAQVAGVITPVVKNKIEKGGRRGIQTRR